jgi:ATP-dependent helicase/nuclease subunit A
VPVLVQLRVDLPGAPVTLPEAPALLAGRLFEEREWNPEQREAAERDGLVFVAAGAGTGKTAVLVERVLRRVLAGTPLESILVITFTERAASELKRRVRAELDGRGEHERAAAVDGAWISTIHRFCARILRSHAFAAGLDPHFSVIDETQARILQSEAFDHALERFLAGDDPRRVDLLAAYRRDRLREMLVEVYERLRSAGRPLELVPYAVADLGAAQATARVACAEVIERDEAAALAQLLESGPPPAELADLSRFRVRNTERFKGLNAAREALEAAARDVAAGAELELLGELLGLFADCYQSAKDERSVVDFADLELRARDLLRASPELAARYRERFAAVMVDEFQDTNRLQSELVDLVAGPDLFLVGDEFQSIYRFRHADVDVYRERRRQMGDSGIALRRNYRSRPHVLAAVNELFRREFGDDYTPLIAEAVFDGPPAGGERVELLLADKAAFRAADQSWRDGEAALLADRLAELIGRGAYRQGQVVVLFEAGTDAGRYEAALRARGLQTVRTTGRGYYEQQEVEDLLAYLRLLRNRYDDVALLSVLASPLVGISNDGLMLLRAATPKRPIFTVFERDEPPAALSDADRRLARAFAGRFTRLSRRAGTLPLDRLLEGIVAAHDYDLACLAQDDGERRYANVRKLARLASDYEGLRGPDLEGFVRFCEEQRSLAAREGEAAIAEEGRDVVVLMTVHAAKGLEFDVVVLADCGRERGARRAPDIVCTAGGRVTFRAFDPASGRLRPALGHGAAWGVEAEAQARENRRLQYVGMTRAREHLLVSGALDPGEETAIAQLCAALGVGLDDDGDVDAGEARLRVRVARPAPEAAPTGDAPASGEAGAAAQLSLFEGSGPASLPALEPPPEAPAVALRQLSYSGLALLERCPYRFFAQRMLGLPEREPEAEGGGRLSPFELGDAVHVGIEQDGIDVAARYPHASAEDRERIAAFIGAWSRSPLRARLDALADARRELPFTFAVDGVVFHGRFDVYARTGPDSALVVDYKTTLLGDASPDDVVERLYASQVTVYALAALLDAAGAQGAPRRTVEVAYAFLEREDAVATRTFTSADADALRARLGESIAAIRAGGFPARPGEHCRTCPALDLLCAGPRLPVAAHWE